jgi:hypothetical protein
MDIPYDIPEDEYALALLTQVAMNSRPTYGTSGQRVSPAGLDPETAMAISNQQRDHTNSYDGNTKAHHSAGLSTTYDSSVLSTSNMTSMFGTTSGSIHNPYMDSAFRGMGNQRSRNHVNNLGILDAETYNNGSVERISGRESPKKSNDPEMPFGLVDTQLPRAEPDIELSEDTMEIPEPESGTKKKKKRRAEVISGDEEDGKKKSRGRPRVDTKDESAADVSLCGNQCNAFLTFTSGGEHRFGWLSEHIVIARRLPSLHWKRRSKI